MNGSGEGSFTDRLICGFDAALRRAVPAAPTDPPPATPGETASDLSMNSRDRQTAGALMRINHTGEVCAQALYQGQAMTARDSGLQRELTISASEESAHLHWCRERLDELAARPSLLDPIWYLGSFTIGMAAGAAGDRWNLGFLAETERQVVAHLESHLQRLPANDARSRAIINRMRDDEAGHATKAIEHGAAELPTPIKRLMRAQAKVLTSVAYWI